MRIQVLATAEGRLGRFTAHDFPNGREVVIGRGDECDLRIDDLQSSRRHARIGWMQGQAFVEDLESKNGTFLHGKPVGQTALRNNDQIQIGSTLLTVTALPFSARTSTTLAFHDRPARVLTTLKQHEADFLADRPTQPPSGQVERPEEVLRELTKISERLASSRDADQAIVAVLNDLQQLLSMRPAMNGGSWPRRRGWDRWAA
jgi:pSer/pThr/pTyr-binding forkhead associated (FHA) protein